MATGGWKQHHLVVPMVTFLSQAWELQILTLLQRGSLRPQLGFEEARSRPGADPAAFPESCHMDEARDGYQGRSVVVGKVAVARGTVSGSRRRAQSLKGRRTNCTTDMAEAKWEQCQPGGRERTRGGIFLRRVQSIKNSPTHLDLTLTPIRAWNEASCPAPRSLCSHPPCRGAGRVKQDLKELAQHLAPGKASEVPCLCRPSPTPWTGQGSDSALAQPASDPARCTAVRRK